MPIDDGWYGERDGGFRGKRIQVCRLHHPTHLPIAHYEKDPCPLCEAKAQMQGLEGVILILRKELDDVRTSRTPDRQAAEERRLTQPAPQETPDV